MTDPALDEAEQRRIRFARGLAELQEDAAHADRLLGGLSAVTVTETSPGREVTVTIGATGLLQKVEYSSRADDVEPSALARVTLATIGKAMGRLQETVEQLAGDDDVSRRVVADYCEGLAEPRRRFDDGSELR